MVERHLAKVDVAGSSPVGDTTPNILRHENLQDNSHAAAGRNNGVQQRLRRAGYSRPETLNQHDTRLPEPRIRVRRSNRGNTDNHRKESGSRLFPVEHLLQWRHGHGDRGRRAPAMAGRTADSLRDRQRGVLLEGAPPEDYAPNRSDDRAALQFRDIRYIGRRYRN